MIGIPGGKVKRRNDPRRRRMKRCPAIRQIGRPARNPPSPATLTVSPAAAMRVAGLFNRSLSMSMSLVLQPLIALIAGILILMVPRLLNYIVAIYLIVIGLVGLFPALMR